MGDDIIEIKPQPGFQTKVAMSTADITIIGGAAGCGKSFIMLYIPLKYKDDKNLRATYFRRKEKQIREQGALWDESTKLYPHFRADPSEHILKWRFPAGGQIDFSGIEHEKDIINFQGAAIPLELFDELTHFTKKQFFFLISRNRGDVSPGVSGCMQKCQTFASCNPDPDSWVADFISWWIDQDTGYPIKERDGVVRYFMVVDDVIVWGSTKQEVYNLCKHKFQDEAFKKSKIDPKNLIKSVTFIGGKVYENPKMLGNNPGYLASLMAQSEADQLRFLHGNWKVRADDSGIFQSHMIDRLFINDIHQDTKVSLGWDRDKEIVGIDFNYDNNKITCDAARFGRDLCVIFVWVGFTVVHTTIFHLSSVQQIFEEIEQLRDQFHVLRNNVVVDQDGVGGDVVKLGHYYGFVARRIPAIDPITREVENYQSRKDQCYFHSAARVNDGEVKFILLDNTVKIYDRGATHPRWSTDIYWNKELINIKVLISRQLRAIKRGESFIEGGKLKLATNPKEEQKEILGHSPDFADNFMMREDLELRTTRKGRFTPC